MFKFNTAGRQHLATFVAAVAAFGMLAVGAADSRAAVPGTMVIEGFLHSTGGGAVADGPYSVTFAIYNVQIEGSPAWTEGAQVVTVKGGQFTHVLGTIKALTAATLDQLSAGWLGMKVSSDPELPRQRLRSVAYAVLADTAKALACSGCITNAAIADKTIAGTKVGFNYADSATKGGPAKSAADLNCTACVSVDELKIDKTLDLGGNALKAKAVAADTVTAGVFKGSGAELTGIKIPTGDCPVKGEVVYGIAPDGKLKCASAVAVEALPGDGIDEISNNLIHNQFENEDCLAKPVPIEDANPTGVATSVVFGNYGLAQKLEVLVDIANSDLSNVTVKLWDPENTPYVLWEKTKPGTTLKGNWPTTHTTVSGDLSKWINKNPQGKWLLQVIDHAKNPKNVDPDGAINKFCIKIKTLSNQKIQVKGDLIVDGTITSPGGINVNGALTIGDTNKACTKGLTGRLKFTTGKGLLACDGEFWVAARAKPVLYRGRCTSNGSSGTYYYCLNAQEVNTATEYLTVNTTSSGSSSSSNTGRITIKIPGYYRFHHSRDGYSHHCGAYLHRNGSQIHHVRYYNSGNIYCHTEATRIVWMNKADYFNLRFYSSGNSPNWYSAADRTFVEVEYMGTDW